MRVTHPMDRVRLKSKFFDPDEYYKRQIVLRELGKEGQEKLRNSKVAIIGLGGLGSAVAQYLTLAGVGHLRLVDQDTVELDNLHRQVLYDLDDLRLPKVEAASLRIKEMNPEVHVEPIPENVRSSNVRKILEGVDCVLDGLDNVRTRYLLNETCVERGIPYIYAAAIGLEGYLSCFSHPETPCFSCIFPGLDDRNIPTCETRGVLGATTGIIGSMEAMEAVKLLAGFGDVLKGVLLVCDFHDMTTTRIEILKNPECNVCGKAEPPRRVESTERLVWLCGQNTVNVNPKHPFDFKLSEVHNRLSKHFKILLLSSLAVVFKYNGAEVSLFKGGRMLIKHVNTEEEALGIYRSVAKQLGIKNN